MTTYIPAALRQLVRERALGTCEYCLIHETFSIYSHEIDHAVALNHGGQTTADNLVLACLPCNRHKGSDLTSIDPLAGAISPIFNPRTHFWADHFKLERGYIAGQTHTFLNIFLIKRKDLLGKECRQ